MHDDPSSSLAPSDVSTALAVYLAPVCGEQAVCWSLGDGPGLAHIERMGGVAVAASAPERDVDWWICRASEWTAEAFASALGRARHVALVVDAPDMSRLRVAIEEVLGEPRVVRLWPQRGAAVILPQDAGRERTVIFDDSLADAEAASGAREVLLAGPGVDGLDPYVVVALPIPARGPEPPDDYARLEARLTEVAGARREAERECQRVSKLARDLALAPLGAGPQPTSAPDVGAPPELARRAAAAVAAGEEARCHAQELSRALERARQAQRAADRREARLEGQCRGLRARLAETAERHAMAEAQLALARADLAALGSAKLSVERELLEAREAVEMALVREHGAPPEPVAPPADLKARLAELEQERDHARAENLRLLALVGSLENAAEGMRRGHRQRVAELIAAANEQRAALQEALQEARGERAGLAMGLEDALAGRARAAEVAGEEALLAALDQADALRDTVAELRAERHELVLQSSDRGVNLERATARVAELASAVAARDALVERLQIDLAEEEQRSRRREEARQRAEAECARLRDAVLRASETSASSYPSERVEGLERTQFELERRLGELGHERDAERLAAEREQVRAEEASQRCAQLESRLGEQRQRVIELEARVAELGAGADRARAALVETKRALSPLLAPKAPGERSGAEITAVGTPAPEDETLLRSLTAQLEERNERIRALEQRLATAEAAGARIALEETVAKLRSDLAEERAAHAAAVASRPSEQEVEELRDSLRERYAEVLRARSEAEGAEAQASALRGALAETRGGLEAMLGEATALGDTATADRVGALLRLLGRF